MSIVLCAQCQQQIPMSRNAGGSPAKYCSRQCAALAYKRKRHSVMLEVGRSVIGAASELSVCADLLLKGYEVFRAVSPHCSCDLIAVKGGITQRVEVRTASRTADGQVTFAGAKHGSQHADLFAAVEYDGTITYIPC